MAAYSSGDLYRIHKRAARLSSSPCRAKFQMCVHASSSDLNRMLASSFSIVGLFGSDPMAFLRPASLRLMPPVQRPGHQPYLLHSKLASSPLSLMYSGQAAWSSLSVIKRAPCSICEAAHTLQVTHAARRTTQRVRGCHQLVPASIRGATLVRRGQIQCCCGRCTVAAEKVCHEVRADALPHGLLTLKSLSKYPTCTSDGCL